jgi:hypothetical protein
MVVWLASRTVAEMAALMALEQAALMDDAWAASMVAVLAEMMERYTVAQKAG